MTHYYQSILRRAPDSGGKTFWQNEATRVANLGASVNEAWFAMAQSFYFSPEYAGFGSRTLPMSSPTRPPSSRSR